MWSKWEVGKCEYKTGDCGPGTKVKTRIKVVAETEDGTCNGEAEKKEECNNECPG